jgi:hypothetical protein
MTEAETTSPTSDAYRLMTTRVASIVAVALATVLAGAPAFAQGKSGKSNGNGQAKKGPATPNQSVLPPPTALPVSSAAAPFAWVDGASVIPPGTVWLGLSMVRWQGGGLSETSVPVIDGALGLTPRVQLGATVPRVLGSSDPAGAQGGLGTTFFSAKIAVVGDATRTFRVAVSPTLEILSQASMLGAATDQSRTQWGLPVSADLDYEGTRFFGSSGFFSPGVWYLGGGAARQLTDRLAVTGSLSRAWSSSPNLDPAVPGPKRHDLSGGASFDVNEHLGVFASIGRTLGTAAEDGAGTTLAFGMSLTAASKTKITK